MIRFSWVIGTFGIPAAAAAAKSLQSSPTLCDPIDGSPPGSPVPGILQARTLEWVAISFSHTWKLKSESEVAQSCPTLSDPMDCSLPGSSIHGIFQARVLQWGATAFSIRLSTIGLYKEAPKLEKALKWQSSDSESISHQLMLWPWTVCHFWT